MKNRERHEQLCHKKRNLSEELEYSGLFWDDLHEQYKENDETYVAAIVDVIGMAMRLKCQTPEEVIALTRSLILRLNEKIFHSQKLATTPLNFLSGGEAAFLRASQQMISDLNLPESGDVNPLVAAAVYHLVHLLTGDLFYYFLSQKIENASAVMDDVSQTASDVDSHQPETVRLTFGIFANGLLSESDTLLVKTISGRRFIFPRHDQARVTQYLKGEEIAVFFNKLNETGAVDDIAELGAQKVKDILIVVGAEPTHYIDTYEGENAGMLIKVIGQSLEDELAATEQGFANLVIIMRMLGDEIRCRQSGAAENMLLIESQANTVLNKMIVQGQIADEDLIEAARERNVDLWKYLLFPSGSFFSLPTSRYLKNRLRELNLRQENRQPFWKNALEVVQDWVRDIGWADYFLPDYMPFDDEEKINDFLRQIWNQRYLRPQVITLEQSQKPQRRPRLVTR